MIKNILKKITMSNVTKDTLDDFCKKHNFLKGPDYNKVSDYDKAIMYLLSWSGYILRKKLTKR